VCLCVSNKDRAVLKVCVSVLQILKSRLFLILRCFIDGHYKSTIVVNSFEAVS
jgi:hypothetical protein